MEQEISCRITQTILLYVRENNAGSLGNLLDGLDLDEAYLSDGNNWVSHTFLHVLYHRMIGILQDDNCIYKMALASERFQSLGILDRIGRLLGNPGLIYDRAPGYNKLLKRNGDVHIRERGNSWVLLEDCYHSSAQKTRYDCDYTRGIITGIPAVFGMPFAEIEELVCQVEEKKYGRRIWGDSPSYGGPGCLYRIRWNPRNRPPFWKRRSRLYFTYRQAVQDLENANRKIQDKYEEARNLAAHLDSANRGLDESQRRLEASLSDLRASEQRYRILAENASDIIWTFDLETMRFTYYSPSVTKVMGYTLEEALSRSLAELLLPDDLKTVMGELERELDRDGGEGVDPRRSRTFEFRLRCRDGSYIWAEGIVSFLRNDEGRPVGVLGVTRDVSERRRSELERADLEYRLQQARKMEAIGTLAGGIAHDFNNLLMSIQGYVSLMLMDVPPDQPNYRRLHLIQDAIRSGSQLTNRILGFVETGGYMLKPTNMNEVISKTAAAFGRTKEDIVIQTRLEDRLPAVDADEVQMGKVLLNLYLNAWQAMPSGGEVILETRVEHLNESEARQSHLSPGDYVVISVRDTGIGMDEAILPRIFEPFFTTKAMGSEKGTGLGLATAYGIVRSHNGGITVASEVGKGTVFHIYLPVSPRVVRQTEAADEPTSRGHENGLV